MIVATKGPPGNLPPSVAELTNELRPGDVDSWRPANYQEWESQLRAQTFLDSWKQQAESERALRGRSAKWIFLLIALQVSATFGIIVADGAGWIDVDSGVLQVMIPSVVTEVFGLGFVVTKYLFSQPLRHALDAIASGGALPTIKGSL